MSAIKQTFKTLAIRGRTAFMPFITAGDPDLSFTAELLTKLSDAGCDMVELGFPYSDPIADGPVIQASYTRALTHRVSVREIFSMLAEVTPRLKMPVVAMVSCAIVLRLGEVSFVQEAVAAGISGVIVPDLPLDESADFAVCCANRDFDLIRMITPTTTDGRAIEIAKQAGGFIYYVSTAGITGERNAVPEKLIARLEWLRGQTKIPVCVGFGISQPEQVKLLAPHADGLIVGSAIVRKIAEATESAGRDKTLESVCQFVAEMIEAADIRDAGS